MNLNNLRKSLCYILFFCGGMSLSTASFADDTVNFFIDVYHNSSGPFDDCFGCTFELKADDGLLSQVNSTMLEFGPHTNVYAKGDIVSALNPQMQTGTLTVYNVYWARGSVPRCQATWQHKFWKNKAFEHSKHDYFKVVITNNFYPYKPCLVTHPVTQSGHSVRIYW